MCVWVYGVLDSAPNVDRKMSKRVTQRHHIMPEFEYKRLKDVTTRIYKGEHMILTRMQWRKNHSKGFCKALEFWLVLHKDKAQDLDTDENEKE